MNESNAKKDNQENVILSYECAHEVSDIKIFRKENADCLKGIAAIMIMLVHITKDELWYASTLFAG